MPRMFLLSAVFVASLAGGAFACSHDKTAVNEAPERCVPSGEEAVQLDPGVCAMPLNG